MSTEPLIGKQLGNFQLERLLGRGGMGQVYYGRDVRLNRPVAVKIIDSRFRQNPAYAKRFVQEAQIVATWRHENIAQVYHADEQDDLYYFAMEYIDGVDLGGVLLQYTLRKELMPYAEVLRVGRAIANALDYAHSRDVIHRDVKPQNVMVAHDGRVVLTDFGLALDVQQGSVGEVFGTAHYIAPEQARHSSDALPQSDLYSLGIILYEMLTGRVPFDDPSPTSVALQHVMEPPPAPRSLNPNLSQAAEDVLLMALAKKPSDRYPSGKLLVDALERALNGESVIQVLPANVQPKVTSRKSSLPWLALGGCFAIFAVMILVIAGFALPMLLPVRPEAAPLWTSTSLSQKNSPSAVESPAVAIPTATDQALVVEDVPTVLYPNGKEVKLFYDNNSFYFLNLSKSDIPINWVAFVRLTDAGPTANRFNGARWGQFYGTSTPTWCMAIKILDSSPYLDPSDCGHNKQYLSLRTPTRDDSTIFWTAKEGSHLFLVLWREGGQDQEVARCEISAGSCQVFFP